MKIAVISDNLPLSYTRDDCEIAFFPCDACVTTAMWPCYDAAILMTPFTKAAEIAWTGHPHLRGVSSVEELGREIDSMLRNIECEKKLLIAYPDLKALEKYHPYASRIEQVYLKSETATHRLRKRVAGETVMYIETVKVRTSGLTCFEYENSLTEQQFNELLSLADENKHPIRKTRYCFLYQQRYFELDIYDFWQDKATLEVELRDESQTYKLPPEITLLRDVTEDKRYKNNYLAGVTNYEDY